MTPHIIAPIFCPRDGAHNKDVYRAKLQAEPRLRYFNPQDLSKYASFEIRYIKEHVPRNTEVLNPKPKSSDMLVGGTLSMGWRGKELPPKS